MIRIRIELSNTVRIKVEITSSPSICHTLRSLYRDRINSMDFVFQSHTHTHKLHRKSEASSNPKRPLFNKEENSCKKKSIIHGNFEIFLRFNRWMKTRPDLFKIHAYALSVWVSDDREYIMAFIHYGADLLFEWEPRANSFFYHSILNSRCSLVCVCRQTRIHVSACVVCYSFWAACRCSTEENNLCLYVCARIHAQR